MGRAYTITVPASAPPGIGNVPISVSGDTYFSSRAEFQIAYDPADFDSDQFAVLGTALSNVPVLCFAPNTILWVRQDPTGGAPASTLSVLTQIGKEDY